MTTTPKTIITELLPERPQSIKTVGYGEAPVNIALIKYWGKRCASFNLPVTDSLSVTVPHTLSRTHIKVIDAHEDQIYLNQQKLETNTAFAKRLSNFLNYFRDDATPAFEIYTENTVATAAGLASSASGFAALVLALNDLFSWQLDDTAISILARLGSGSACRSLWPGFVHWQAGIRDDGLDSYAKPLHDTWPGLMLGLMVVEGSAKPISSREAMQLTTQTSPLYRAWPHTVQQHLNDLRQAIQSQDFEHFGRIAEQNALAMHATMLASSPSIDYRLPASWTVIQQVYQLRRDGIAVYFTQDAGPNIKLLFEVKDYQTIAAAFPAAAIQPLFD